MTNQHETQARVSAEALRGPAVDGTATRTEPLRRDIPQASVARLAVYLRALGVLSDDGRPIVSSEELATAAGVGSATLRKDLSFLGPNGVRGVGYDVERLRTRIEGVLGLDQGHRVILAGVGNLGRALAGYHGFQRRGFAMVGLFDTAPAVIGRTVAGLRVRDMASLAHAASALAPTVAVLTVPDAVAQQVCDQLVAVGVRCILSFVQAPVTVPAGVELRRVDLAMELQLLSFSTSRNQDGAVAQ